MFHEYRDLIAELKQKDNYFHSIFDNHNALDEEIIEMEKNLVDQFSIEVKKKEKLKIKDEIYNVIIKYKSDEK